MDGISPRQLEILTFVHQRVTEDGVPPSYREIGDAVGIRSTNGVAEHINALVDKGFLIRVGAAGRGALARALRISDKAIRQLAQVPGSVAESRPRPTLLAVAEEEDGQPGIPVLGRVAAGPLTWTEAVDSGERLQVGRGMVSRQDDVFALKVDGRSMVQDGILPGDYVFVRKGPTPRDGQIAVVMVDKECTLKRFFREGALVRLQPANDEMAPIYVRADELRSIDVMGVVVGVWRRVQ